MKTAVKNRKTVGFKAKPKFSNGRKAKPIVSIFREFKKAIFGKSQKQSMDLLDQWILKKKPLSRFYRRNGEADK